MSQVNFILTGGELTPQYRRAIRSANVHGAPVVLFYTERRPDVAGLDIEVEKIEVVPWLQMLQNAHRWDVLAYYVAWKHGGLMLGLDTISVRNAFDLLDEDTDVVVSTDCPPGHQNPYPYNNIFIARKGTDSIGEMYEEAEWRARNSVEIWGFTGPLMLTQFVNNDPLIDAAPFPAFCGWEGSYIWRFYLGLDAPDPETRVIHLFSSAYRALYEGDPELWLAQNPAFEWEVRNRTNLNAELLRL